MFQSLKNFFRLGGTIKPIRGNCARCGLFSEELANLAVGWYCSNCEKEYLKND